ncbi:MAG: inlA 1 [Haloplasmataceae bacterium]|jgi:Leucine-rich repeat (LRR) protein|nr:inlA 1 [Haloplasmataceae bacterium]
MLRKSFYFILLFLAVILLSSCESKGTNEFLPDNCKTYNEFVNLASKEFYDALKANELDITKRNYLDIVANTKSLVINTSEVTDDFSLSGIECFQYLNKLELNGMAINDITPLYNLSRVEEVIIKDTRVNSLDSLTNMVKITALTVNNTKTLQNLDGIETLTRLEKVNLSSNALTDITKISGLPNVKELTLNNNALTSIDILETLPKLTTLDVSFNRINFNDKTTFNGFTQLQTLNIRDNQICNTEALGSLVSLVTLDISANNLNNYLQVSECNKTEADFTFLSNMENLNILIAESNNLTSVATLIDVDTNNLTHLSLKLNQIDSINPIVQNPSLTNKLTNLYLSDNKLTSVANIHALSNLEYLDLNQNEIVDITDVFELANLTELYLSHNLVTVIPSLVGKLTQLTNIDLSYNELTTISGFKDNNSLTDVDLSFNHITDIVDSFSNMSALVEVNLVSDITSINLISKIENSFISLPKLSFTSDNNLKLPFYTSNLNMINSFKELPQFVKADLSNILITNIDEFSLVLPNVTEVNVSDNNITHIKWTNNLPKLTTLTADNNKINLIDFVPTHFDLLTDVSLTNNDIVDTTALGYLTNIENLHLAGNHIITTSFLSSNAKLKILNLNENDITDTSGIKDLVILKELYLNDNEISTLNGLTNIPLLTTFEFMNNSITKIDGLSNIGIENIDLSFLYLTEISANSFKANKFKALIFQDDNLLNIEFAKNLTYLEDLYLNNVSTTNELDITPISDLTNLKVLILDSNNISNIDALKDLNKLEFLSLKNNQITTNALSTDPSKYIIDNFNNLTDLYLEENNINELNGLNYLTDLITFSIDAQEISTIKNAFKDINKLQTINGDFNYEQNLLIIFRFASTIENSFNATIFKKLNFPFGSNMTINQSFINLTTLDLNGTGFTNDRIGFINDLKNLVSISFNNNNTITSLTGLDNLTKLTTVDISNSAIDTITSSFNNCPALATFIVDNDTLNLNTSLNSVNKLQGRFNNLMNTSSLTNLKALEINQFNYADLDFIKSFSKLESLSILYSTFDVFELDTSTLKNLKSVDLSGTSISLMKNSFNNSTTLSTIKLGNMKSMVNVFNDLPNLKFSADTLIIKTGSSVEIDKIEKAFNRSNGFKTVIFENQKLAIIDSFDTTQISKMTFNNPKFVTELTGFNNTKLDNFELTGFTSLFKISGFSNAKFSVIVLNVIHEVDLTLIDKSKLKEIYLNNVSMTSNEVIQLVNNSPLLTKLTLTNTITTIDWLSIAIINNLDYIDVNNISSSVFAELLANKTTEKTIWVQSPMEKSILRNALFNELNNNLTYYHSLVELVDPDYEGNPDNDQVIKTEVVDYLMERYTIIKYY